jgi:predicted MFS family arabinose efflux permease
MLHFPGHAEQVGASESRIGLLYSSAAVAALAARPALGKVLDLVARRSVLLGTGLANAVVLVGLVAADEWAPPLWGLFLLQRVLQIFMFTAMLTVAADLIPVASRARGLALFGLSGLVPISVGGALGDVVVELSGFDALFLCSAAAALGSWAIVWRLPQLRDVDHHEDHPRRGFWAALAQPDLLPLWLVTFCFALGLEAVFSFLRVYVDAEDVGSAGAFFALYGIAGAITRIAGRGLYERVSPRPFMTAALLGYATGLSALAVRSTAGLVAAAFVCGIAHGAVFPMISSQVVHRARDTERGSAMSIFTALFDIALLLGAPAAGFLIEARGFGTSFLALAAVQVVGAIVYASWDKAPRPRVTAPV